MSNLNVKNLQSFLNEKQPVIHLKGTMPVSIASLIYKMFNFEGFCEIDYNQITERLINGDPLSFDKYQFQNLKIVLKEIESSKIKCTFDLDNISVNVHLIATHDDESNFHHIPDVQFIIE